jgi:hypothetical protein
MTRSRSETTYEDEKNACINQNNLKNKQQGSFWWIGSAFPNCIISKRAYPLLFGLYVESTSKEKNLVII